MIARDPATKQSGSSAIPARVVEKAGPSQKAFDWLFGYDYFIAHRSVDGKKYASALYDALTTKGNELDCFLDVKQYAAGGGLTNMQARALRKTTRLIVVVTPHAHDADAPYLHGEVAEFRRIHLHGIIVPIGTWETLTENNYPNSELLPLLPHLPDDICILESAEQLSKGEPSPQTVAKLLNDFSEERRSTKRLRWIRRVAVLLLILFVASAGFGIYADLQRREATRQKQVAESRTRAVQAQGWAAQAELALEKNRPQLALLLSAASLRVTENAHEQRSRMAEQSARNVLAQVGGRFLGRLAKGGGFGVAISPNSRWLAIATGGKELDLWDLKSPKPEASKIVLEDVDTCSFCGFTPDSKWLVTDGRSPADRSQKPAPYTIRLWKVDGQDITPSAKPLVLGGPNIGRITNHGVSRDAHWLAAFTDTGRSIQVWDLTAVDPAGAVKQLGNDVIADLCFVGNDQILASAAEGGAVIWDLHNPARDPIMVTDRSDKISRVAASPDGRKLVTLGSKVTLWERDQKDHWTPTVLAKLEDSVSWIYLIGDGRWLLSGNPNGSAYTSLVDLDSKNPAQSYFVIRSYGGPVGCYAADPEGRRLLLTAAGYEAQFGNNPEKVARVWLLLSDDPTKLSIQLPHSDLIFDAQVASTQLKLATGAGDGSVRWWTIDENAKPSEVQLRAHEGIICRVKISPDERWLVTTSVDGTARLWDLRNGNAFGAAPRQINHSKSSTVMSPDGKWLFVDGEESAIIGLEDSVRFDVPKILHASNGSFSSGNRSIIAESPWPNVLYMLPVGQELTPESWRFIKASGNRIASYGVNKDGRWLAVTSRAADTDEGTTIDIFDLSDKEKYNVVKESLPNIVDTAWSPDGSLFAAALMNGSIAMWRATAEGIKRIEGDLTADEPVRRVLFSPDGQWLASGSWGGLTEKKTVWLWRMKSGAFAKTPVPLKDAEGDIRSLTWSRDGKWLAGTTIGKPLRLWHFDSRGSNTGITLPVIPKVESMNIQFSYDGRWLFTAPYEETPRIWDLHAAHPVDSSRQLGGHSFPAVQASFSQDSRWLTTADYEIGETDAPGRSVRVWDMQADNIEESSVILPGLELGAHQLGSTKDSQWLITSSDDGVRMTPLGVKSLLSEIKASNSRPLTESEQRQFAIPSSLMQISPTSSLTVK